MEPNKFAIFDVAGLYTGCIVSTLALLNASAGERYLAWRTEWDALSQWRTDEPLGPLVCDMPNIADIPGADYELGMQAAELQAAEDAAYFAVLEGWHDEEQQAGLDAWLAANANPDA